MAYSKPKAKKRRRVGKGLDKIINTPKGQVYASTGFSVIEALKTGEEGHKKSLMLGYGKGVNSRNEEQEQNFLTFARDTMRLFKTPIQMQKGIDRYFKGCVESNYPLTVTGLALSLGTTRSVLLRYANSDVKPMPTMREGEGLAFSQLVKRALTICEHFTERELHRNGGQVAGAIFALKASHGWREADEDKKTDINIGLVILPERKLLDTQDSSK